MFLLSGDGRKVLYSPFDMKVVKILDKGWDVLEKHYQKNSSVVIREIEDFFKKNSLGVVSSDMLAQNLVTSYPMDLTLSLTSGCNLACIYCYARAGEDVQTMDLDVGIQSINFVAKELKDRKEEVFSIVFHGGGETLFVFPLMKKFVNYVKSIWSSKLNFFLVTNGTLITKDVARFLKENSFRVSVSIDGNREIQSFLRPSRNGQNSYDNCVRGMSFLLSEKVPFSMRATLTRLNLGKLDKLISLAKDWRVPLNVEPVTQTGRGEYSVSALTVEEFISAYEEIKTFARKNQVKISSSYDRDLTPKIHYCGGDGRMFCVLPNGDISSCSRVTREDDLLVDTFVVGNVSRERVSIKQDRLEALSNLSVEKFDSCSDCFARWYCAGGCHNTRLSGTGVMPESHCNIMRYFLWQKILEKLT